MQTEEKGQLLKQHLGSSPFSFSPTARRGFLKAPEDGNDNNASKGKQIYLAFEEGIERR